MIKTIKVIDLFNKIANGEDAPEKILYKEKIFEFDKLKKCYITSNFDNTVMNDLGIYLDDGLNMNSLNDTVEIIEEQQDIDYWEEISNAFREYSDKLIERFDEISKLLKNKVK